MESEAAGVPPASVRGHFAGRIYERQRDAEAGGTPAAPDSSASHTVAGQID